MTVQPGSVVALAPELIRALRDRLNGLALVPGDDGYNEARALWNAMIDKHPAVIVRCLNAADVAIAITFARANDLPLSVKAGGHGVAGKAVVDDGVMIDLSPMNSVEVDAEARMVQVGGGALLGDLDRATQEYGLATTAGIAATTGVAGLTLGGGIGLLMRRFGLSCDNLLAAEMVTASGQLVTASVMENPDLFWGLRGGGGNFGVVTTFTFQLHKVGPTVVGGLVSFPFTDAPEVVRFYREITDTAPEDLSVYLGFNRTPDGQPAVGFVVCFTGPSGRADAVLDPIRTFGQPLSSDIRPRPYVEMQSMFDEVFAYGKHHYWKSSFLNGLTDEFIDALIVRFAASPYLNFDLEHMGGAIAQVNPTATAFADRTAAYTLIVASTWDDPVDSERNIAQARETWQALQEFARDSVYINYMDIGDDDRIEAAYGPNYERLVRLKAKYDPDNLFRNNQNIVPSR